MSKYNKNVKSPLKFIYQEKQPDNLRKYTGKMFGQDSGNTEGQNLVKIEERMLRA